jgi:hypothetical protein
MERRVACGLPPDPPIYDISPDAETQGEDDYGILLYKRVRTYKDAIIHMADDGSIIKEYKNTPELEKDGYQYLKILLEINNVNKHPGFWWIRRSQYDAMTGLQRLMYMKLAPENKVG